MNTVLYPPIKIALNKTNETLAVIWKNGEKSTIPGLDLRRFCACSRCRSQQVIGMQLITDDSGLEKINAMGSTALHIVFRDGHDRGVYPWDYLYAIAKGSAKNFFQTSMPGEGK
ncbi:MAG: DUF971 family protein [Lentisphaeria bacterium]